MPQAKAGDSARRGPNLELQRIRVSSAFSEPERDVAAATNQRKRAKVLATFCPD
jgi:hypothetical protein